MSNACDALNALCVAVGGITKSLIEVVAPTGEKKYFFPVDDTNDARTVAFGHAVNAVVSGGRIVLIAGGWILSQSIKAYAQSNTNWKLEFQQGAWLNYINANVVDDYDYLFYDGANRYSENHGIFPNSGDMHHRIQAALFTMPLTGDGQEPPPHGDYPNMKCRRGILYMRDGSHKISKSVYFTSYQQIIGIETRSTAISQMPGFAPAPANPSDHAQMLAAERFSFHMMPAWITGTSQPSTNFSFACRIINIAFDSDSTDNVAGSALLMGGAQGSEVDNVTVVNIQFRGLVYWEYSTYFRIGYFWGLGNAPPSNATGPRLEMVNCSGFTIDSMNLEFLNNFTIAEGRKTYKGFNLAGAWLQSCYNFSIGAVSGESIGTLMVIGDAHGFDIGPCQVLLANQDGVGETMVHLIACENGSIGPLHGKYFEKLVEVYDNFGTVYYEFVSGNAVPGPGQPTRHPAISFGDPIVHIGKLNLVGFNINAGMPAPAELRMAGAKVLTEQQPAIANSADPTTNAILVALRTHGIIAT